MTSTTLGWLIAGICVAAFIAFWFSVSFRELSAKSKSLDDIKGQVNFHRRLYMQERGGENDTAAQNILESKLMVYREVEQDYNALLKKTKHRIPGYIMGFQLSEGQSERNYSKGREYKKDNRKFF